MKERHPIDDLFRDKLQDYSLEAPMHLWDQVAEAAGPERQRRALPWFWIGLGLLIFSAAVWGLVSLNRPMPNIDAFPIAEKSEIIAEKGSTEQKSEVVSDQVENTAPAKSTAAFPDEITSPVALDVAGAESGSTSSTTAIPSEELPAVPHASPTVSQQEKTPEPASVTADLNEEKPPVPGFSLLAQKLDLLEVPDMVGKLECARFNDKVWATAVDVMASMDFAMRQLEARNSDFQGYAKLRDDTETFRHGFSVGMRFSTISVSGFAVRSGLNYSQINEQLNFKIKEEEKLTITTRYDTDGSIIGTDTAVTLVETFRVVNNSYHALDIPLLVGYEIQGDKFSFSVNGGAFINMLAAQRGEFVSPNTNQPVAFTSSDPNAYRAFRNRIGMGLYGSMGFYFQFGEDMQILFEPYAKWRPGSITADGYLLDQRYLTAGLFVGLRKYIL